MLIKVFLNPAVLLIYIYFIKTSPHFKERPLYLRSIPILQIKISVWYQAPTRNRIKLSPKELKDYNQVGFKLLLPIFPIHIDAIIITCYFYFSTFFQFFIILMYVTTIIMKSFELNTPT